jgi:TonB family protein
VNFMKSTRVAALLACALAFAAIPANAQRARDPQLLSDKPAPREGCGIARQPGTLPTPALLADSVALARSLAEFAQEYPIRDGKMYAVYSVAFAADGSVERVAPIDYWLPQGREPELTAVVRAAIRAQRPGNPWSLRLRVEPASEPLIRVGRSEVCQPRSTTRFELTHPALAQGKPPEPMRVRVLVGTQGRIRGIDVLRGSGDAELDRWVESTLLSRTFLPGLVDGVAVEMQREEEVRIRYRP